jgi:spore coat polysaccharide biosynthesis predicted glycosyltransferase SpsG
MPKVLFLADAGDSVGSGHVFRVYPVFKAICLNGFEAEMCVPLSEERLWQLGLYGVQSVPTELPKMIAALEQSHPTVIVIDTYRFREQLIIHFQQKHCKVVVFDDHLDVNRKVSLIINSSLSITTEDYSVRMADKYLLGAKYTSLSSYFSDQSSQYVVAKKIAKIMVALGGTDVHSNIPTLLAALFPNLDDPVEICVLSERPMSIIAPENIKLTLNWVSQDVLASYMREFDLAILAGGTMLWQTACVGLPTLSWPQTRGQVLHAATWADKGVVLTFKEIADFPSIFKEVQFHKTRQRMSDIGRSLVDGKGANRIAGHINRLLAASQ